LDRPKATGISRDLHHAGATEQWTTQPFAAAPSTWLRRSHGHGDHPFEAPMAAPDGAELTRSYPKCRTIWSCLRLPELSGLDFQTEQNIHIPIIFMTGHGDIPMTVRAMKAGAVIS
jgi:hypothetical protein